jgi:nucleotide-binding universal stress UspA family protein
MRILIAYDGSECADAAIDDLARAGLPPECQALVLSVADLHPRLPADVVQPLADVQRAAPSPIARRARDVAASRLADARARADAAAARLAQRFPRWTLTSDARGGSPAAVILDAADHWTPDLLVVGSQGRSAVARMVFGSVSQKLLTHAPCSVRVARAAPAPRPTGVRIVVGIDGSTDAALAVSAVAARTWPAGTEARVVTALDDTIATVVPSIDAQLGPWVSPDPDADDPLEWARRAADASARDLTAAGITARATLVEGEPTHVLLDEAGAWNADCIFLGARGLGRLERFLLGSVSSSVAARAPCSVEVVRSGAT